MFHLEVLAAKHGDCLIVHYGDKERPRRILIDGGPPGVYNRFLKKWLKAMHKAIKQATGEDEPVEFELAMVSHVDQDHIKGLLDLTNAMIKEDGSSKDPAIIKRFWHNSFEDITGGGTQPAALTAAVDAIVASANAGGQVPFAELADSDGRAEHILAGIGQGGQLRDNLEELGLDRNRPFDDKLVLQGKSATMPDGMELAIIGPDVPRLTALQEKWNPNLSPTEIAAITDSSVANLSSIVVLAKFEGKSLLLTGDARGDDIIDWLKQLELLKEGKTFHVDVLKIPHHGSDRNVDEEFFKTVTADVYVYCGDGKHDNPDHTTLKMMREARAGANYKVVFSNPIKMQHANKQDDYDAEIKKLEDAGIVLETRDTDELSIMIKLN